MNNIKVVIIALLLIGVLFSCNEEDKPNPEGLSEIILSNFSIEASEDGTIVTVTPVSIGASSYSVDFGDPSSDEDVLSIEEQGGSVSYDYPNISEESTYTISVTALSDVGLPSVTMTQDVEVVHIPTSSLTTTAVAPTRTTSNVFALFSDGMELNGELLDYRWGEVVSGGTAVTIGDENVIRLSRLGSETGTLTLASSVDPTNAFGEEISATHIHFDVYSDFAEGIDILKLGLVDNNADEPLFIEDLVLSNGEWTSFDLNLSVAFSGAISSIDQITFELGTGGAAKDHASIYLDNIYLYKETGSTILNGDFEIEGTYATSQWRFTSFTDGTTDPFGSSSDGSNFNYQGNDAGNKTRGAKWSSSQQGGPVMNSADSRYAYQALNLLPNTDYVLQYQYALDVDNEDPSGLTRHLAGAVLDGHFLDGADALDALGDNLGIHLGYYAEGKFSNSPNGYGTFVEIPFTSNASGEVSVMFYSVVPDDAWMDNVKVLPVSEVSLPVAAFDSEESAESYLTHSFSNNSINGASFEWDFGDGTQSSEKSPSHTYVSDGNYTVTLTAKNSAGSNSQTIVVSAKPPAVVATFEAVVLNSSCDEWTNNTSDNADAWDMTPSSTIVDNTGVEVESPYRALWNNSDLNSYIDATYCTNEQPGSTSDGNKFTQTGDRGVKIYEACRRLYQAVKVEVGVEYTFTIDSRSEASDVPSEVYILNTAITDEIGLDTNGKNDPSVDAYYLIENDYNPTKSSTADDTFTTNTFTFKPTTTEIIIYVRAPKAVDGDTEVFYDNIDIITPGF